MYKKIKRIGIFMVLITILINFSIVKGKSDTTIVFKDKSLQSVLSKNYNFDGTFTKENAAEFSRNDDCVVADNAGISDMEGIQYFSNLTNLKIGGNNLSNLQPLSQMKHLIALEIPDNAIKGKRFINTLNVMGRIESLGSLILDKNGLTSINFLKNIGNFKNYELISMRDNKIRNIYILKGATNLEVLDLADNRITDVTPLKDLDKLTFFLDLHDNCIIDYKPIKHLIDKMYEDFDEVENGLSRYDFYTNPINFMYKGKKIKFPYLTAYYKYQAYAEATPLFKALGGSAQYNKKTGTLTCKYDGNVLVFKDFSKKYLLNGKEKSLTYPMRRMQYDLAYIPVKDICDIMGLNYKVVKTREFCIEDFESLYAPKLVEISKNAKELG